MPPAGKAGARRPAQASKKPAKGTTKVTKVTKATKQAAKATKKTATPAKSTAARGSARAKATPSTARSARRPRRRRARDREEARQDGGEDGQAERQGGAGEDRPRRPRPRRPPRRRGSARDRDLRALGLRGDAERAGPVAEDPGAPRRSSSRRSERLLHQAEELAAEAGAARPRARRRRHAVRRGVGRGRHRQRRAGARSPAVGIRAPGRRGDRRGARPHEERHVRRVQVRRPQVSRSSASSAPVGGRVCRLQGACRAPTLSHVHRRDAACWPARSSSGSWRSISSPRRGRSPRSTTVRSSIIGDDVELRLSRNTGGAFSLFQGFTPLLAIACDRAHRPAGPRAAPHATTRGWWSRWRSCSAARLGNLVDRAVRAPGFLRGAVVDFVSVGGFPTFNVADAAITVGAVLLVLRVVFGERSEDRRAEPRT